MVHWPPKKTEKMATFGMDQSKVNQCNCFTNVYHIAAIVKSIETNRRIEAVMSSGGILLATIRMCKVIS